MKGVVFTELLDYVEEVAGYAIVNEMIERSDLPTTDCASKSVDAGQRQPDPLTP